MIVAGNIQILGALSVRDSDQKMVSVTRSMDSRLKYTIYTDMQRHRHMVYHKQDGVIINKLIADLLRSGR